MERRVVTNRLPADLADKEERDRLTLEALADVNAGPSRTHDHAEVEAWAASLGKPKGKPRR
jgi:hypothetical protein